MKILTKINKNKHLSLYMIFLGLLPLVLILPNSGWCETDVTVKIKAPVEKSIRIRQKSQKDQDNWEQEKTKLLADYESLKSLHEELMVQNKYLKQTRSRQKAVNQDMIRQKQESLIIRAEMLPFLKEVFAQIEQLVKNDPPFLEQERSVRLKTLAKVLDDVQISIAEKYRKVMEALFIEAEYGSTIEVYQDKVVLEDQEVLGNIFRLGRVSLFFLTLDQQQSAYYNVAQNKWLPLADDYLLAIRSAVGIGGKRKPAELLALPLGKISPQRGPQ